MDLLEKKEFETSRGLHYRYFVSPVVSTVQATAPTIVLCHGWPDSAELWQFVIPHLLQSKCRIVALDLLGAGGSSKPTDPAFFEIRLMVRDVMEILKSEGIEDKLIPVGHDWGSYFAQRLYLLNKPVMAGLVTLNVAWMAPRGDTFVLEDINAQTEAAIGYPMYAYWELFADPNVGQVIDPNLEATWVACHGAQEDWMKTLFCTRGAMRKFISAGRTDIPLKEYAKNEKLKNDWIAEKKNGGVTSQHCWYRAMAENYHQATEKTLDGKVTTPYLFIGCDGDPVCRTDYIHLSKLAGLVKEEDLEVHELHSGHWSPYEKPEEVADLVVKWLKKNGFSD